MGHQLTAKELGILPVDKSCPIPLYPQVRIEILEMIQSENGCQALVLIRHRLGDVDPIAVQYTTNCYCADYYEYSISKNY